MALRRNYSNESNSKDDFIPEEAPLSRARKVATEAHEGQRDKQGLPYVSHCERVASQLTDDGAKIVALLHDCLEKGEGWSPTALYDQGFSAEVIGSVEVLTRRSDESEHSFLTRIARDRTASDVKIADLEDNIKQCRAAGFDETPYRDTLEIFLGMTRACSAPKQEAEDRMPENKNVMRSLLTELGLSDPSNVER